MASAEDNLRRRTAVTIALLALLMAASALVGLGFLIPSHPPQPARQAVTPPITDPAAHLGAGAPVARPAAPARVPYIVSPNATGFFVSLWASADGSSEVAATSVPKGTRCTVLETKELAGDQGGTWYRVRAVSGEVGWLREHCLDFRLR